MSSRKNILLIQGLYCHYEMLGSFLYLLKDNYNIYLLVAFQTIFTDEYIKWKHAYKTLFNFYPFEYTFFEMDETIKKSINSVIIHTDSDQWANLCYNLYFSHLPVLILNHNPIGCRFVTETIPTVLRISYDVIGSSYYLQEEKILPVFDNTQIAKVFKIDNPENILILRSKNDNTLIKNNSLSWACVYNALSLDVKLNFLTTRPSICIIGSLCTQNQSFFNDLFSTITNIHDIDIFIINRKFHPSFEPLKSLKNVKFLINVNTNIMFYYLTMCHYVYVNTDTTFYLSGQIPLAISFLSRLILGKHKQDQNQYSLSSPLYVEPNRQYHLEPLNIETLSNIVDERQTLIKTQISILNDFQKRIDHIDHINSINKLL